MKNGLMCNGGGTPHFLKTNAVVTPKEGVYYGF